MRYLKLDQYLISELFGTFVGSIVFILFILLMFQMLRLADFLIIHGAAAFILGRVVSYMIISFLPIAFPLAFLISLLTTMGRLSTDSELIAIKACGISTTRLTLPLFVFAIPVVLTSMALNWKWVPWAELESRRTINKIGSTKTVTAIHEGTFTSGFFDMLIFADKVDTRKNLLHHVFIYDERETTNPAAYIAKDAELIPVKTASDFSTAMVLRLHNGSTHQNNLETHTYEKMAFNTYDLFLKNDEGDDGMVTKPQMIPQKDLLDRIAHTTQNSFEGREMRAEYWRRYATALSPLIFVLLGIGFGAFRQRTAKTGAILTAFLIIITYWLIQTFSVAAVQRGLLSPLLAMQMPNLILLGVGFIGLRRAAW